MKSDDKTYGAAANNHSEGGVPTADAGSCASPKRTPGQVVFPYRELYIKFKESLTFNGSDLKNQISASNRVYAPTVYARCCRAAVACLEQRSKSGAANIRTAFLDDQENLKEDFYPVLKTFFDQLGIASDAALNNLLHAPKSDRRFDLIAAFFAHQAEIAFDSDGLRQDYVSILKNLFNRWWSCALPSFADVNDKPSCMAWFNDNASKFYLAAELSPQAREDNFLPEGMKLAPPSVGECVIDDGVLGVRTALNDKNEEFWKTGNASLVAIISQNFSSTGILGKELATEILVHNDFPDARWEIACVVAGLVKFEWKSRGQDNE